MSWLITVFFTGVIFAFGWKAGMMVIERVSCFIAEYPANIRKVRRYCKRRKNNKIGYTRKF